jgi:hypothetical protein
MGTDLETVLIIPGELTGNLFAVSENENNIAARIHQPLEITALLSRAAIISAESTFGRISRCFMMRCWRALRTPGFLMRFPLSGATLFPGKIISVQGSLLLNDRRF